MSMGKTRGLPIRDGSSCREGVLHRVIDVVVLLYIVLMIPHRLLVPKSKLTGKLEVVVTLGCFLFWSGVGRVSILEFHLSD